jgi:hypothetical protein
MSEPLVPRDEVRATLEARQELGAAYEDELVERFAQRVEARLKERAPARRANQSPAIAIVSLLAAIPMLGIAGGTTGVPGIALVCLALVLVNYFAHR